MQKGILQCTLIIMNFLNQVKENKVCKVTCLTIKCNNQLVLFLDS